MKRRDWNEEQIKQLLQQLPSVNDKRTADDLYRSIQFKHKARKKPKTWVVPAIATVAALFIFMLISPYIFQGLFSTNEESAMDMATTSSEGSSKLEKNSVSENNNQEFSINEETTESIAPEQEQVEEKETFITSVKDSEKIITIGLTDGTAQNILPVSVKGEVNKNKLEQIQEFDPEAYRKQLGPVSFELINTEFYSKENAEEIIIEYKGEPIVTSSANENTYKESIRETFRWLGFEKAKLFTNGNEGIEFGNTGVQTELEITEITKKAYLVYQYDENTSKLLVPSPEPFPTIEEAIDIMKRGLPEYNLNSTIFSNIGEVKATEDLLEIRFNDGGNIENNEHSVIMLESLLLTAKEFGYKTVKFNGLKETQIGQMDLTKPIEVPFSPNPIK